jgi:hypothetical protein
VLLLAARRAATRAELEIAAKSDALRRYRLRRIELNATVDGVDREHVLLALEKLSAGRTCAAGIGNRGPAAIEAPLRERIERRARGLE